MEKSRLRKLRNRALAAVTAAATSLGLLVGSVFDSPADLLERKAVDLPQSVITDVLDTDTGDSDSGDSLLPGEEKRKSLRTRLRQKLLELPWQLRAATGLPLWLLGWGVTSAASALWSGLLSPIGGAVLGCAGTAAAAAAAVGLTAKAVFPDMPLKRIFSRRSVLTLLFGSAIWGISTAMLELLLPEFDALRRLAEGVFLLIILLAALLPVLRKEKERLEVAGSKGEDISDDLASYRRQAKDIADSAATKAN